jgi:predicted NAD/FAD-binding protein
MGAAIWSCPTSKFEKFPIRFICDFYRNHGLLSLKDRPTWRVIKGGSRGYVQALTRPFRDRILLSTPVRSVVRGPESVAVEAARGVNHYDEVIFACHSDQALSILGDQATAVEKSVLGAIPYESNTAVLHTDISLLPRRTSAWASWNYHIPAGSADHATLTYNMNILQHIQSRHTFCVTLNEDSAIAPEKMIAKFRYSHPVFTTQRKSAQQRHGELIRNDRLSFCGAYWGNGFHEDGVNSGLAVASAFEETPVMLQAGGPAYA